MDLADKLIARTQAVVQEESDGGQTYVDDLGIPTIVADKNKPIELRNNVDYYVCRIIVLNNKKVEAGEQGRIHKRGGILFIGNEPLQTSDFNLFRLCTTPWPIPQHIKPQIWDRLYELVPTLSCDKIVVSDHLAFNKKTGRIEWSNEHFSTTGQGGFNA